MQDHAVDFAPAGLAVAAFSSAAYWEQRYRQGGHSGAGSYGRLAAFKADFLNAFIRDNAIASAIEFGCGDGNQLTLLEVADYAGIDVAAAAVQRCRDHFGHQPGRQFRHGDDLSGLDAAALALSLDVIYHLVEDAVFAGYLENLFAHAHRFVVIYASDIESEWPSPHVRHRRFTAHVAHHFPDWLLAAVVPNLYPYDPHQPDDTSFAAFHVYRQPHEPCRIAVPARR